MTDFGRSGLYIPYGGDAVRELPVQPGLEHRGYALVVARFVPENTILEFFQAVERIANRQPVVIVGSSGYGGEFDEIALDLAARHPNVHAYGHVRDDDVLQSLWQHAGVYFHGHSVGGTNPALVQAMASGAPTVALDTPYNREVLQHHGVFVGRDPEQIAVAIDTLLLDRSEQDRLSDGARARAGIAYTWAEVCADYERALRGLIPSTARAGESQGDDGQPRAGLARL
jgi:glycosyltransferase involved in cell wall biosynthesis